MTTSTVLSLTERITVERINKSMSQPFTVRSLAKKPDKVNFTLSIQRNLRWSEQQKSALIESILLGYPIPPVYILKTDDAQMWALDGKQRLTTLISFCNNEWELTDLPEVYGIDINGMKFEQLPEEFKELIEEQNINFYQFDSLSNEQRDQLFLRLNSGTPLSAIELTRSILGSYNLDYINTLIETKFMQKVIMSDKQREKFVDQELILQCIAVITGREYNLSGKSIREFAVTLSKEGLTDDEKQIIKNTFNYLSAAFKETDEKTAKKVLKKADVVAIAAVAVDATDAPGTFADVLTAFINNQKAGSQYKTTSNNGSAKPENVQKRIDILRGVLSIESKKEDETESKNENE